MHSSQFIPVKRLAGELIVSRKRGIFGLTLTTRELVFQKPNLSYHLMLEDIIGILPFTSIRFSGLTEENGPGIRPFGKPVKITATRLVVIHRGGATEKRMTDLVIPMPTGFMEYMRRHTDFIFFPD
ncbi:hypothetical protein [Staphylospora marina]|uniref:hypothetical protein n=1 Tax=Staphylospora marina TaxID=2490858 RepID=UPI000F5BD321|nr:hypothetical protein [Staphylospora marina]